MVAEATPLIARKPKLTFVSLWASAFMAAALVAYLQPTSGEELVSALARRTMLGGFWGLLCNLAVTMCLARFRVRQKTLTIAVGAAFLLLAAVLLRTDSGALSDLGEAMATVGALSSAVYLLIIVLATGQSHER